MLRSDTVASLCLFVAIASCTRFEDVVKESTLKTKRHAGMFLRRGLYGQQYGSRAANQPRKYMFSFKDSIVQQYPMTIAQGNVMRECYIHRGKDYIGHINTTVSGHACQPWAAQTPYRHSYYGLASHGNYCRNPMVVKPENCQTSTGCIRNKPWCITTKKPTPGQRRRIWEFCNVPKCQGLGG